MVMSTFFVCKSVGELLHAPVNVEKYQLYEKDTERNQRSESPSTGELAVSHPSDAEQIHSE